MSVSLCTQCGSLPKTSLQYETELDSSSLLYNLRTSNFPATDQESSHIQHNILPNIDVDISSISAKINSLQQELDALTTVRNTYRALISPCRAVPRELWEQIFSYVHQGDQIDDEQFTVSDPTRSIWSLAKVCQTWRAVAVSLHSCWTKLRLGFPKDGKSEKNVQVLEVALQRSGQHPLDIILVSDYEFLYMEPSIRDRMLAMVHAESHRWRAARLADQHSNMDLLYAPLRGRLPMLELLNLHLSGDLAIDNLAEQPSVFSDCPRLTKVVLTGTRLLELPWTQTTELRLEDIRQDWVDETCWQYVSLVARCPNLLVLQARNFDVEELSPPSSIICPSIRVLDTAIEFVMDCLTLPNLQEVILSRDVHYPHEGALVPFHRLLQRSRCSDSLTSLIIRDISLYDSHTSGHDLYAILSAMSHLEVLDIQGSMKCLDQDAADARAVTQIKKVLDALSVASQDIGNGIFLPRLSSFDLNLNHHMHHAFPYCDGGSLVAMLKARWDGDDMRGLAKLKRFRFTLSGLWLYVRWRLCDHVDGIGMGMMRRGVFSLDEGRILHGLAMDGMDVAIKIQSVDVTTTVKSKVAQQVPGEPSQQEAEYRELYVHTATTY